MFIPLLLAEVRALPLASYIDRDKSATHLCPLEPDDFHVVDTL